MKRIKNSVVDEWKGLVVGDKSVTTGGNINLIKNKIQEKHNFYWKRFNSYILQKNNDKIKKYNINKNGKNKYKKIWFLLWKTQITKCDNKKCACNWINNNLLDKIKNKIDTKKNKYNYILKKLLKNKTNTKSYIGGKTNNISIFKNYIIKLISDAKNIQRIIGQKDKKIKI